MDILARTRRDTAAARRFFRKLLERFLSAHGSIVSHFRPGRHRLRAPEYGQEMIQRFPTWRVATGFAASGTCGRQRAGREHITVSSVDTAFPILPGTRSVVTLMARADISAAFLRHPLPHPVEPFR